MCSTIVRSSRRILRWVLPVALLGVALSGCRQGEAQAPLGGAHQAMPVPVVEVVMQDLPLHFEYPAQVAGIREVEIRARVSGIIEKRLFQEGGRVKQGQALYRLDDAPYQAALARALADENAAKVRLAQAERDFKRVQPLIESKAVSQAEFDNTKSAMEVARADVMVAASRVRDAKLNIQYSKVEAPVAGVVGRSLRSEGSLVSGPTDLLTTVTQVDQVYVNFGFSSKDHEALRQGLSDGSIVLNQGVLMVDVLGEGGKPSGLSSKLSFRDVRVNSATSTVDARAVFPNAKELLSPGQFLRVRVSGATQKQVVLLPQRAVLENPMGGGKVVMTVTVDNKVEPRPVQVAQWSGSDWVVYGGLQSGDKVMTDGFLKVQPGMVVRPVVDSKAK
jgi:membrane fusion protein (multidrug efflux system)